jgi:hypothetical protein
MRPDPDGRPGRLIREIDDVRCPYCAQPPVLLRTAEYPEHADAFRWRVAIGCRLCRVALDDYGATEQAAIDGVVRDWSGTYPQPIDVRDALAIRPGRP